MWENLGTYAVETVSPSSTTRYRVILTDADLQEVISKPYIIRVSSPSPDINGDGEINLLDFSIMANKWLEEVLRVSHGLVAYYNFNYSLDEVTYDSSGNNNNGNIHEVVWSEGKVGNSILMDGKASYVEIPHSSSLKSYKNTNQLTISTWIYVTSEPNNNSDHIFWTEHTVGHEHQHWFSPQLSTGVVGWRLWDINENYYDCWSSRVLDLNKWYHLAGTFDGSTMKLYIDGTIDTTVEAAFKISAGTSSQYIGTKKKLDFGDFFQGLIDEFRLYNRALTEGEIEYLYNNP